MSSSKKSSHKEEEKVKSVTANNINASDIQNMLNGLDMKQIQSLINDIDMNEIQRTINNIDFNQLALIIKAISALSKKN